MTRVLRLSTAVVVLLGLTQAGTVPAQSPAANYSAFPCLSYTLPCGKIPTRKPVHKALDGPLNGDPARGKQIAQARNRGNCLACHAMKEGTQPGTRGTDLRSFGNTQRSDAEAYAMVYDMRTINPDTLMPPFGTNEILNDQEIRDVVAFLQSSK